MKLVNCNHDKCDVYIGRPSKWGNPYSHKNIKGTIKVSSRKEAIEKYRIYLQNNEDLLKALPELKGKVLGCWCAPKACHGNVLLEFLEEKNSLF
jgi:hypothetical protein